MVYYQTDNSTKPFNYNVRKNKDYCFPSHLHRDFELAYVEGGSCTVTIDGKTQELTMGEFALILPNCIHSYFTKEKSLITVYVFSKEYVGEFHKICKGKKCDINCFNMSKEEKAVFFDYLLENNPSVLNITTAMNLACSAFFRQNNHPPFSIEFTTKQKFRQVPKITSNFKMRFSKKR